MVQFHIFEFTNGLPTPPTIFIHNLSGQVSSGTTHASNNNGHQNGFHEANLTQGELQQAVGQFTIEVTAYDPFGVTSTPFTLPASLNINQ